MVVMAYGHPPLQTHFRSEHPGRIADEGQTELLGYDAGLGERRARLVVKEVAKVRLAPNL